MPRSGFHPPRFTVSGGRILFVSEVGGLAPVLSRKPFRIRTYEKCARKSPAIRSYKIIGLKVHWNE